MKDKSQLDYFKETARKLGADESDDTLDKIMGKLDLKRKPDKKRDEKKNKPAD
jgi:hypothetical protein